ncbi:V-set domain-containing T-cell activation inhibitor 1 isoform X1 [Hippocampus comes]|uniref:V-set domain-containing T-cell activation inhibitor 1 isoform X1 n=1 Tax=Hippocampus comes TaxID=109280 RepID=UPI00094E3423|nr:PREDICTED: V-set domain-containing T-cell activation inhibitor 1 isoform X1 [Hippocampus comes]
MASLGQIIFYIMITLIAVFSALIILILSLTLSGSLSLVQSLNRLPVANLGKDYMLSCFLPPDSEQSTLQEVSVTWRKESLEGVVYRYEDGAESTSEQDSEYSGRVEIFRDVVPKGNASLLLRKVRRSDAGKYTCSLSHSGGSGKVNIILRTAAFTAPTFTLSNGVLTAEASRWFPRPNVTWLDADDNVLQGSTDLQQSSAGIFRVVSTLQSVNVSDIYTCSIKTELVVSHSDATVTTDSDVTMETYFTFNAASPLIAPYLRIMCVFYVYLL